MGLHLCPGRRVAHGKDGSACACPERARQPHHLDKAGFVRNMAQATRVQGRIEYHRVVRTSRATCQHVRSSGATLTRGELVLLEGHLHDGASLRIICPALAAFLQSWIDLREHAC